MTIDIPSGISQNVQQMETIPEDLEIYFKCGSDIDAAFKVVQKVVPGATYEAHVSEHDGILRYYLTFPQGEYDGAMSLLPVIRLVEVVDTAVVDVDEFGFDVRIGFLNDTQTDEQYDSVINMARAIGKVCPTVLYTSETPSNGPLVVDTRA